MRGDRTRSTPQAGLRTLVAIGAACQAWAGPVRPELGDWRARCYNCYNHATNVRGVAYFAQPGGGVEQFPFNAADIIRRAEDDGLTFVAAWRPGDPPPSTADCPAGSRCLVAAAIIPADAPFGDFHWYRLNDTGQWSHKPGSARARIFTNDGVEVADPATADRGRYFEFVGYFCVPNDPPPALTPPFGEACDEVRMFDRAVLHTHSGLIDPRRTIPSPTLILPHLPAGPAIPDPEWPDFTLRRQGHWGFGYQPRSGAPLPFVYYHVFEGVVAAYADPEGQSIVYFEDTNGLAAALAAFLLPCVADANADHAVNMADLNLVLGSYGLVGPLTPGDVNRDGATNFGDLNLVLAAFGQLCQ